MNPARYFSFIYCLLLASLTLPSYAEQAIYSPDYDIHYNAFNTMMVPPEVAQSYGFTRARNRALLNISVLDSSTKKALPAVVTGTRTNIIGQLLPLEFVQIKEQNAIYYIAQLRFTEEEMWRFELQIQPDLNADAIPLKFSQTFYLEK
jgi:hypothetical protein|tara:strand:+ start:5126 stop:5569 length:444 start_codon:yes stop_codon:yes gene_type:complete